MSTLVSVAEWVITGLVIVRMVVVGFLQPPGRLFSWPMFTRGCQIDVDLTVRTGPEQRDVDIFTLLPSHHPAISSVDLQIVVDYLAIDGGEVSGRGMVFHAGGTDEITVEAGCVVV